MNSLYTVFKENSIGERHCAEESFEQRNISYLCFHFESILKQGKDLIHLTLSSGISGTYNSACTEDARNVASLIEKRFPNLQGKVEISTIGSHTGPGTVALFFWGSKKVN